MKKNDKRRYWQKTRRLTLFLLTIWLLVTFGITWYAREINELTVFGFPLGFYMSAQGSLLVYLLIIGIYNRQMSRLDKEFDIEQE